MTRETRGRKPDLFGKKDLPATITREQFDRIDTPPDHLNEDGKIMWYQIHAWGETVVQRMDNIVITEICEVYQEKELLRRMLDMGTVPRWTRSGTQSVDHPAVRQLASARKTLEQLIGDLGFKPITRSKMGIGEDVKISDALEAGIKAKFAEDQARKARQAEARARRAAAAMAEIDNQDKPTDTTTEESA